MYKRSLSFHNKLPQNILKFFWGDNLKELELPKHKDYITKTILEKGDRSATRWLFRMVDRNSIRKVAQEKKMDPKSKNFWNIYFS